MKKLLVVLILSFLILFAATTSFAVNNSVRYVITNDDVGNGRNSVTFYRVGGSVSAPTLTRTAVVETGGMGLGTGFASANGLLIDQQGQCAYVANSGSADVASIDLQTQTAVGKFRGSWQDSGGFDGVGLAMNGNFLYASYTGNYSLATYQIGAGCQLSWIGSIPIIGQNLGMVAGMAARNNILVVAYGDGSIESYDISNGVPKSNGDRQLSTGTQTLLTTPFGVEITKDAHFAIFGDASSRGVVEVSDISGGSLVPTAVYKFWFGSDSNNVLLSPDERMLYVSNNVSGTVSAAFFDNKTGQIFPGCISSPLKGLGDRWFYTAELTTSSAWGSGNALFVTEFGWNGSIAIVNLTVSGHTCTLMEDPASPILDPESQSLRSIALVHP